MNDITEASPQFFSKMVIAAKGYLFTRFPLMIVSLLLLVLVSGTAFEQPSTSKQTSVDSTNTQGSSPLQRLTSYYTTAQLGDITETCV